MTILPKSKKRLALLCLLLAVAIFAGFQTHTFPALDTNNVFIGSNSFSGTLTANGNGSSGNVAIKADTAAGIRYVSNSGSDTNDGLSWGTAKLTIAAACATIPNQDSTCLLPFGVGTLYVSDTFGGSYPAGFLTGGAKALKIIGPGYIQADSSLTSARGAVGSYANASYMFWYDGGFIQFLQAGPRGPECFPITAVSITANVLTVTCTNTFTGGAGQVAKIFGTAESFLNYDTNGSASFTVVTATGSQWTANFTHANYTSAGELGSALAEQKALLASNTYNLPDLTGGTNTPTSGALLGIGTTDDAAAGGNCLFYNGATSTTGISGLMKNSGIGCNGNVILAGTNFFCWKTGANTNCLGAPTISATTQEILPIVNNGNIVLTPAPFPPSINSGVLRVTGSDFTDASSTALQTITGLSIVLPANTAYNYAVDCHIAYSQATGAVADNWGIQAASLAPTNIFAQHRTQITAGPPSTYSEGTLATLSTTTATNIGQTFTPGVIATVYNADIHALIENPSGVANTVNVMVAQSTAANLITVKRGSWCRVY